MGADSGSLSQSEMGRYLRGLDRTFDSYDELWQWSVGELDGFWARAWRHYGPGAVASYEAVLPLVTAAPGCCS